MVTTGTKFLFGVTVLALLGAMAYGFGTGGGLSGVLTFGLLGGVGDASGYVALVTLALAAAGLGVGLSVLRDADPEVQAVAAQLEQVPPAVPAPGVAYWPVLAAFAGGVMVLGLVASQVLFVVGAVALLLVAFEWTVQTWADRATGDAGVNREIRNRMMYPIEIPVVGALVIGGIILASSRIFLALPALSSALFAVVAAAVVLGICFVVAYKPALSKNAIAGVVVVVAVATLGGGLASALVGQRSFEHHEPHGEEEVVGGADEGEPPAGADDDDPLATSGDEGEETTPSDGDGSSSGAGSTDDAEGDVSEGGDTGFEESDEPSGDEQGLAPRQISPSELAS